MIAVDAARVTRTELALEAARLRATGMTGIAIAERLGVSRSYAYELLNDPDGARPKARKRSYEQPCVDCGARVSGNDGRRPEPRCFGCAVEHTRRWTPEAVIAAIRQWATENNGRSPAATDWGVTNGRWPAKSTVMYVFGSWNAGIAAAGLPPRRAGCYGRPGEDPDVVARTVELYREGNSLAQIGAMLGMSGNGVRERLVAVGEPRRPAGRRRREAA